MGQGTLARPLSSGQRERETETGREGEEQRLWNKAARQTDQQRPPAALSSGRPCSAPHVPRGACFCSPAPGPSSRESCRSTHSRLRPTPPCTPAGCTGACSKPTSWSVQWGHYATSRGHCRERTPGTQQVPGKCAQPHPHHYINSWDSAPWADDCLQGLRGAVHVPVTVPRGGGWHQAHLLPPPPCQPVTGMMWQGQNCRRWGGGIQSRGRDHQEEVGSQGWWERSLDKDPQTNRALARVGGRSTPHCRPCPSTLSSLSEAQPQGTSPSSSLDSSWCPGTEVCLPPLLLHHLLLGPS